jgi:uncharacterized protein YcbX
MTRYHHPMPEIADLIVYPIKSLSGVSLDTVEVQSRGLQFDRRWMLVETDGAFITQRDDPTLVKLKIAINPQALEASAPGLGSCKIPFEPEGPPIEVQVWKSVLSAPIVCPAVDEWFSEALGRACHLVAMPPDAPRMINPDYGISPVSFADGMPILVLSELSVQDLNQRLATSVPANRFRANVILRGTQPYEEDSAISLRMGDVELRATKRCGRCLVICTDQETSERVTEPLRTLAAYRTYNNNACMGMFFYPQRLGPLSVGQTVVIET